MNSPNKNEKGWGLGLTIIAVLILLMILPNFYGFEVGPVKKGPASVMVGLYLQFWGILFLLSYFYSHKTFFFRGLMWICNNFSYPSGPKMAFFYFALGFGLGSIGLLKGLGFFLDDHEGQMNDVLPSGAEPIENWWYKDPMLYVVLIIAIGVIYYRNQNSRK